MPDPTPQILELSNRFRAQLLARERQAATAMVRYYGESWRRLQTDINKLRTEIEAQRDAGEDISVGRLWRLERMQAIQSQAELEMAKYAQFADTTITAGQREAIVAGERNAHELILGAFPKDAIEVSFATMPREAVEQMIGFLADGSPLRDLLTEAVGDSMQRFGETMVTGLAAGWNPRKLARELRSSFGMGLTRSLRIARTEQLRAYRTATLNSYRESGVVKGWERHAALDTRTCMACISLDGTRYDLNTPMDDHVQGRCLAPGALVTTDRDLVRIEEIQVGDRVLTHEDRYRPVTGTSKRPYSGDVVTLGPGVFTLCVTPEHPVWTDQGWVAAKDVRSGVKWSSYQGPVYNLQVAEDESYIANGIVVHNCAMLPITKSYAELGIDAPEPDFTREKAQDWFRRQSEADQALMMGPGAFEAWQAGQFKLEDYPKLIRSDVWGNSWVPKSLGELVGDVPAGAVVPPRPTTPSGKPVSDGLKGPKSGKYAKRYNHVLDVIDSVHGDGDLPGVPLKTKSARYSPQMGGYKYFTRLGKQKHVAHSISINGMMAQVETVLSHEVGHYLDHQTIDGGGYSSAQAAGGNPSSLDKWWTAVTQSDAYKTMQDKRVSPDKYKVTVTRGSRSYESKPQRSFIRYLMEPQEVWARSYTQYVAEKSGDRVMLEQVEHDRQSKVHGEQQWATEDFRPIRAAIDDVFLSLGWVR